MILLDHACLDLLPLARSSVQTESVTLVADLAHLGIPLPLHGLAKAGSTLLAISVLRLEPPSSVSDFLTLGFSSLTRNPGQPGSPSPVLGLCRSGIPPLALDRVQFGSILSLQTFAHLGSALSLLSFVNIGSSPSARSPFCCESAVSPVDFVGLGFSPSLQSRSRTEPATPIALSHYVGSFMFLQSLSWSDFAAPVLDYSQLGPSAFLRSFGKLGAFPFAPDSLQLALFLSPHSLGRFGLVLPLFDTMNLGLVLSLHAYSQPGAVLSASSRVRFDSLLLALDGFSTGPPVSSQSFT